MGSVLSRLSVALFVVLSLVGCGPTSSNDPRVRRAELSGDSPLIAHFREAERESGVPAELLATIAYAQTRLSMQIGAAAHEGHLPGEEGHNPPEHGLMAIGTGGLTTLEVAAMVAKLPVEKVATEPRANIRAAAAVLRTMANARGVGAVPSLDAWLPALEAYGGDALVRGVRDLLITGWKGHDDQGFLLEVSGIGELPDDEIGSVQLALGYPGAKWSAAYSGNYQAASRGAAQINYIVIHTVQGSYAGCISWFKNSSANVSAHYVVRSSDGEITQMVDDSDIAWHDACFNTNTIGIEHEGYVSDPGKWYTDAMYKSSAKLAAWLCDQYGIPKDHAHIMGHGEAPDCSTHTDPGPGWNWSKYLDLVKNGGCLPKTEICNGKDDDCDGKTDEGDVCNDKPKGYLDAASCDLVKGWAQDPDAPAKSIDVHLYFGGPAGSGAKSTSLAANVERKDLCSAIGSCNHGFEISPPLSLFDGEPHAVHAYGIDSAGGANSQLTNSPKTITCPATMPTGVRRHVVNPDSFAAWKFDEFWDVLPLGDWQIASLPEGEPLPSAPSLVQADDGSTEVWLVDGDWRRHVPSPAVMKAWGFAFADVVKKPAAEVDALSEGLPLRPHPLLVKSSNGKLELIDDPRPDPGSPAGAIPPSGSGGGTSTSGGAGSSGKAGAPTGAKQETQVFESDDGGCSVAGGAPRRIPVELLVLAALPWLLRRRRAGSTLTRG